MNNRSNIDMGRRPNDSVINYLNHSAVYDGKACFFFVDAGQPATTRELYRDGGSRARPKHFREQVRPGGGHEVPGVHAGALRRHLPRRRHPGARVRRQGRARC